MIDLEHPREWKRKIAHLEKCLPHGSPYLKKINKAFIQWQSTGATLDSERIKASEKLYDNCIEAEAEIERKLEERKDRKRWFTTTIVSITAMLITASSLFLNAYYQRENLKVNKERLSYSLKSTKELKVEVKPELIRPAIVKQ